MRKTVGFTVQRCRDLKIKNMAYVIKRNVKIKWTSNFTYAIDLITSDGSFNSDRRHIWFSSAEEEMLIKFKNALNLNNKIGRYARGGEKETRYFYLSFGGKIFYQFLNRIGIFSAKSKTIRSVAVPAKHFPDFLRGLFDGDGSFYTFQDKRWPNSFSFKLSIASASIDFIQWLKLKLTKYGVKGYLHKGAGVWNLEYVKGDTKKLYSLMYYSDKILYLNRKYYKMKNAIEKDVGRGLSYLQKPRSPKTPE